MSRRAPRTERESPEMPTESPWLMRGTFLLIPLLFLGCWILTYRTLQPRESAGGAAGAPPPTPTTSLALKLPAAASAPGYQGPPESPTPGAPGSAEIAVPPTSTAEPSLTPTATEAPTASPTPAGVTYVVKSGDTLSSIARSSNVSVEAIAAANHLKPPYPLRVGDRLSIPAR